MKRVQFEVSERAESRLREFCKKNHVTLTALAKMGMETVMVYKKEKDKNPGSKLAIIDEDKNLVHEILLTI